MDIATLFKGKRTYLLFGFSALVSIALIIWGHFEPNLLPDEVENAVVTAFLYSMTALGMRRLTTTPPGISGE